VALLALAGTLAGCVFARPEADLGVTRLSPPQSLVCVEAVLAGHPVRMVPAPAPSGWRLDLQVLSSSPPGRLDKGALMHDGQVLAYLPNGATEGLNDDLVREAVDAALDACR
jgi:hypothetical protein